MIVRRNLLKLGALAAAAAPFAASFAAPPPVGTARPAITPDEAFLRLVHPDLRVAAANLLHGSTYVIPTRTTLGAMRSAMTARLPKLRPDVPTMQRTIPGATGQPDVAIVVVNARADALRPAILHTHGGGFVAGSAALGLAELQEICVALDCVAVSVDYRLAPEIRWTGSCEDTYAALKWLHDHAFELGAHPDRIAVMGEGAGGGHAALLAIMARDRGEVPLVFQCLTYPMLDDRTVTRKFVPHVGRVIWTPEANRFGWECFLGMAPAGKGVPAASVPARCTDLAGLPPAFIGAGALDLLFNENADYAQRLNVAGVPAQLAAVPGAFHEFDLVAPQAPVSAAFRATRLDALRRALALAPLTGPVGERD